MLIITLRLLNHNREPGLFGCIEKRFLQNLLQNFGGSADIILYSSVDSSEDKHRVEPD